MTSLLCPLSDFPYMLPECVPVGTVLMFAAVVPVVVVCWHLAWRQRTHGWMGLGARVRGRVSAATRPETEHAKGGVVYGRGREGDWECRLFAVRRRGREPVVVDPRDAELIGWPRRVRTGCRVTVLGVTGMVRLPDERLYRECPSRPGVLATRIVREGWPPFRWLTPLALGGWLVFALLLLWYCGWSAANLGTLAVAAPPPVAAFADPVDAPDHCGLPAEGQNACSSTDGQDPCGCGAVDPCNTPAGAPTAASPPFVE